MKSHGEPRNADVPNISISYFITMTGIFQIVIFWVLTPCCLRIVVPSLFSLAYPLTAYFHKLYPSS